ncbi:MAG: ABC transporter substrate-binding protein [Desulfosarcinaceae bacterium]|nr:ABC transporter substrate-binding protein [Desulfosarcinaceae bacterium]
MKSIPVRIVAVGTALWGLLLVALAASPAAVMAHSHDGIHIAAIFSLTGHAANANRTSLVGTRIAVDEINAAGGLLGQRVNLIVLDNMSTPIGSSMAANQAVAAGVAFIVGAAWSSHSLSIAEVAQRNRIPMISNISSSPKLTRIGDYIFRVCFTDNFQGRIMAEFARYELGARKAILFVDLTSDYSLQLSAIFRQHFEGIGGEVISEIEYKARQDSYEKQIQLATTQAADVVFIAGHDESGIIANHLQMAGIQAIFIGGDGWSDPSFFELGGNQLTKAYYCSHWSAASENPQSQAFARRHGGKKDFGVASALAYDAVMIAAAAIEKAGSTAPEDIRTALAGIQEHNGITGAISFDGNGDPFKCAVIMEIEDGAARYLKTLCPR